MRSLCRSCRSCRRGRRCTAAVLEHIRKGLYLLHLLAEISRLTVLIGDYLYLGFHEIGGGEYDIIKSAHIGNYRVILSYDKEHILDSVGKVGHILQSHHCGRTLDGVHDTEDLIDLFLAKAVLVFGFHKYLVKLFNKRGGLEYVHIDHRLHTGFKFRHFCLPSFPGRGDESWQLFKSVFLRTTPSAMIILDFYFEPRRSAGLPRVRDFLCSDPLSPDSAKIYIYIIPQKFTNFKSIFKDNKNKE